MLAELFALEAQKQAKEAGNKADRGTILALEAHDRINKILEDLAEALEHPGYRYANVVAAAKRITGKNSKGDWNY